MNFKDRILYYSDFVLAPILVLLSALSLDEAFAFLLFAFGCLLFTFVEYWVHRTLLHKIMWHDKHQRHHLTPAEYVVFPFWYIPLVHTIAFVVMPLPLFSGWMLGYTWFIGWHHILHHWDLTKLPAWVARYSTWHEMHHHKTRFNYGITHPLWDIVFGTYKSVPV